MKQRLLHYQTLLSSNPGSSYTGKRQPLPQYVKQQLAKPASANKRQPVAAASRAKYDFSDNVSTTTSHMEEVERLHELVHFLRSKLADTDSDCHALAEELKHLKSGRLAELEAVLLKSDVEKLALQKRLNEIGDVRQLEATKDNYEQLRKDHEQLQNQLHSEMSKRIQLEKGSNAHNLELIIEDLKKEKEFLRKQYATLLTSNKENPEIIQRDLRIEELETELSKYKSVSDGVKSTEADYQKKIKKLNAEVEAFDRQQQEYANMKKRYDSLMEKLDFLGEDELNTDELDEAIAFMRLRREKGLGPALGMIRNIDEMLKDRKLMDKLRIDHLKCVEELEKTKDLLKMQEKLNSEVKKDLDSMKRKIEVCKGEYEIKLLENSKLLDARSHRISHLEGQLSQFVNGDQIDNTLPIFGSLTAEEEIKLLPGENLIEIKIESAKLFSTPVVALLGKSNQKLFGGGTGNDLGSLKHSKSCDMLDPAHNLVSFVSFDFYDFVTQISRIAGGLNPKYGYRTRFKVTTDDFFVEYLSCSMVSLEFWRHIAGNSQKLGVSKVSLRDLLTVGANESLKYAIDISDEENDDVLGQLIISMTVKVPISDSLRSYKERIIVTQSLEENSFINTPVVPSLSKESVARDGSIINDRQYFTDDLNKNKLLMSFNNIENLKLSPRFTNILVSFSFYCYGEYLIETSQISNVGKDLVSAKLKKNVEIDLTVSVDLDSYFNNEKFEIDLFGESNSDDIEYIGKAFFDLSTLTLDQSLNPTLTIVNRDGANIGELSAEIKWLYPYRLKRLASSNAVEPIAPVEAVEPLNDYAALMDRKPMNTIDQSEKVEVKSEGSNFELPIASEPQPAIALPETKVTSPSIAESYDTSPASSVESPIMKESDNISSHDPPNIEQDAKVPTFSVPLMASDKPFDDSTSLEVAVGDFVSHTISEAFNSPTLDEFEFPISPAARMNEHHDPEAEQTEMTDKMDPIVNVSATQWHYNYDEIKTLQQEFGFTHVFACIEFDELPFDEEESLEYAASFYDGGSIDFGFRRSFDFSGISMGLKFQKFLDQNRDIKVIIAGIHISEDGSADIPVDLAYCEFKLLEVVSGGAASDRVLQLPVKSLNKFNVNLGVLDVQISGLGFVNEVCRVMEINIESIEKDFHQTEPAMLTISSSLSRIQPIVNDSKSQLPITGSFAKLNSSLRDLNMFQQSPAIPTKPSPNIQESQKVMYQSSSSIDDLVEHVFEANQ